MYLGRHKVQNVNYDIISTMVVHLFKMSADVSLLLRIFRLDLVGVGPDSVHTPKLCLAYILHFTRFTRNAVNKVSAFAGHIFPGIIASASKCASYPT